MPTRYNAKPKTKFGVPALPTGFNSSSTVPEEFTIPSVGVEDVDRSLFELFNLEIPLLVSTDNGLRRVPIIFAAGEKWAILKSGKALRDKNDSLILPLITITRNNIIQTAHDDIAGRGINQQLGELVIQRRLHKSDRDYQRLINRLLIKNQLNVAVNPEDGPIEGQVATNQVIGDLSEDPAVIDGGLLMSDKMKNVYETIVVPTPQFFTANYDITIWTQYQQQMNQVIENLISSFLPQGNAWKLDTKKGYWFIATVDGNVYNAENNFDDMSKEERLIKHKFSVKVPGYILATASPGAPVPLRRFVSCPQISFETNLDYEMLPGTDGIDDPFLGADDPTLPLDINQSNRKDQRETGRTRLYPGNNNHVDPGDPALLSVSRARDVAKYRKLTGINEAGEKVIHYLRVKSVNRFTGEVIYAPSTDLGGLKIITIED